MVRSFKTATVAAIVLAGSIGLALAQGAGGGGAGGLEVQEPGPPAVAQAVDRQARGAAPTPLTHRHRDGPWHMHR
jgi:hypothetical protein